MESMRRFVGRSDGLDGESREDTLQGPPISDEFRISRNELRSTRFLTAVTAVTAVVLAMVMVFGFQLMRHVLGAEPRGAGGDECQEGEVGACDEDSVCIAGRCVAAQRPTRCQPGDPCTSDCTPSPSLRCDPETAVYVPVNRPEPAICDEAQVSRFINEIGRKCGSLSGCKAEDLKNLAIDDKEFLQLMVTFPDTVAIHFPAGKPSIAANAQAWPNAAEAEYYVESLLPLVPQLQQASAVLVVALASRGGKNADAYSLERAKVVVERLIVAATDRAGLSPAERDTLDPKIKLLALGDRKQLTPAFYGEQVLTRSIAWDRSNQDTIRSLIEQGDGIPARSKSWLKQTINQTVFVVPIPCRLGAQ
ncbi:hypothetical protein [Nannocystis sp. SCPEA4]|uniref:hypothetical protein n=1 Tax=Nannocystis sp. SCPEA4 TaxID=2996787 RepID=UPI00226EAAA8|nr:hypothetical protein [Nannocystis sp. SCPEA4]MCY1056534.1 hypothetical protein [Nannocystis sp. SCPEA4]